MLDVKSDDKLIGELDLIQQINKAAYLHIKKNVEAVCRKTLMEEAEKAFLRGDNSQHVHFRLDAECNKEFADYLGISAQGEKYVFLLRHSEDFGAVFVPDGKDFITDRYYLFGEPAVFDAYRTFDERLHNMANEPEAIDLDSVF
jgi:hypothetical protein